MKNALLLSMWVVASTAAVAVAWAGVSVVDDQIVDPPSAVGLDLPSNEVALEDRSSGTFVSSTSSTSDPLEPMTATQPVTGETTQTSTTTASASPPSTAPVSSGTQPTSTSTTSQTTSTSSTSQATSTSTTSTTQVATTQGSTTKTFDLVGGTTAVSFSASGVQVLWATPNPGFDVDIENEGSGMKVEFESEDHESRIDVWWSGGPQHEIRESAD